MQLPVMGRSWKGLTRINKFNLNGGPLVTLTIDKTHILEKYDSHSGFLNRGAKSTAKADSLVRILHSSS